MVVASSDGGGVGGQWGKLSQEDVHVHEERWDVGLPRGLPGPEREGVDPALCQQRDGGPGPACSRGSGVTSSSESSTIEHGRQREHMTLRVWEVSTELRNAPKRCRSCRTRDVPLRDRGRGLDAELGR